jgi:hypothetical protein
MPWRYNNVSKRSHSSSTMIIVNWYQGTHSYTTFLIPATWNANCNCFLFIIDRTHREVSEVFSTSRGINVLDGLADRGWDVKNRLYLGYGKWRLQWSSAKTEWAWWQCECIWNGFLSCRFGSMSVYRSSSTELAVCLLCVQVILLSRWHILSQRRPRGSENNWRIYRVIKANTVSICLPCLYYTLSK